MSGCFLECESIMEFGPPPDLISAMPPPPIPTFLRDPVDFLVAANGSCNLCGWAYGDEVQLVEITRNYPVVDDVWYFIVVSAAVGAILISVLILIAALRCKDAKVKPAQQSSNKHLNKVAKVEKREFSSPHGTVTSVNQHLQPIDGQHQYQNGHKTVWSSLPKRDITNVIKGKENGTYILQHHIINPDNLLNSHYEKIDYGSIDYAVPMDLPTHQPPPARRQVGAQLTRFPALPLPPIPLHDDRNQFSENGVHFTPDKGHAYYANPDILDPVLDGSFDNNGFVDSEMNASFRRPGAVKRGSRRQVNQPSAAKMRRIDQLPQIQTTNSTGLLDHLVIRDGQEMTPGFVSHFPMVTQIHVDRNRGLIRSTALV